MSDEEKTKLICLIGLCLSCLSLGFAINELIHMLKGN